MEKSSFSLCEINWATDFCCKVTPWNINEKTRGVYMVIWNNPLHSRIMENDWECESVCVCVSACERETEGNLTFKRRESMVPGIGTQQQVSKNNMLLHFNKIKC